MARAAVDRRGRDVRQPGRRLDSGAFGARVVRRQAALEKRLQRGHRRVAVARRDARVVMNVPAISDPDAWLVDDRWSKAYALAGEIHIGRGADSSIILRDPVISRRHASV